MPTFTLLSAHYNAFLEKSELIEQSTNSTQALPDYLKLGIVFDVMERTNDSGNYQCSYLDNHFQSNRSPILLAKEARFVSREIYQDFLDTGKIILTAQTHESLEQKKMMNAITPKVSSKDRSSQEILRDFFASQTTEYKTLCASPTIQTLGVQQFWQRGIHIAACRSHFAMQFYFHLLTELTDSKLYKNDEKTLLMLWALEEPLAACKLTLQKQTTLTEKQKEKLFSWLITQANQNDTEGYAAAWLGMMYLYHKNEKDKAVNYFIQSSNHHHPDALYYTALAMEKGWSKDSGFLERYHYAAAFGSAEAYYRLSELYKDTNKELSNEAEIQAAGRGYHQCLHSQLKKTLAAKEPDILHLAGVHSILEIMDVDYMGSQLHDDIEDKLLATRSFVHDSLDLGSTNPITAIGHGSFLYWHLASYNINVLQSDMLHDIRDHFEIGCENDIGYALLLYATALIPPNPSKEFIAKKLNYASRACLSFPSTNALTVYEKSLHAFQAKDITENEWLNTLTDSLKGNDHFAMTHPLPSWECKQLQSAIGNSENNTKNRLKLGRALIAENRIARIENRLSKKNVEQKVIGQCLLPVYQSSTASKEDKAEAAFQYYFASLDESEEQEKIARSYCAEAVKLGHPVASYFTAEHLMETISSLHDKKQKIILHKVILNLKASATKNHLPALKQLIAFHQKGTLFGHLLPKSLQEINSSVVCSYQKTYDSNLKKEAKQQADKGNQWFKKSMELLFSGKDALESFLMACRYLHSEAYFYTGLCYYYKKDLKNANTYFASGMGRGDVLSHYGMGELLYYKDPASRLAREHFHTAAEAGVSSACLRLVEIEKKNNDLEQAAFWEARAYQYMMPAHFDEKQYREGLAECKNLLPSLIDSSKKALFPGWNALMEDMQSSDKKRHNKAIHTLKSAGRYPEVRSAVLYLMLALCYESGIGVKQNYLIARCYSELALPSKYPFVVDIAKSVKYHWTMSLIKEAADDGDPVASLLLSEIVFKDKYPQKAKHHLTKAMAKLSGDPSAYRHIMAIIESQKSEKYFLSSDTKRVQAKLIEEKSETLTQKVDALSTTPSTTLSTPLTPLTVEEKYQLASHVSAESYYLDGISQEKKQRFDLAYSLFKKASEQKLAKATLKLAEYYVLGQFVKQSNETAIQHYELAVQQGDQDADVELGKFYLHVARTPEKGLPYLTKASENGSPKAKRLLAICYRDGLGVTKNEGTFLSLCQLAAEKHDDEAQYILSKHYWQKNEKELALSWCRLAVSHGNKNALKFLNKHNEHLSFSTSKSETEKESKSESKSESTSEDTSSTLHAPIYQNSATIPSIVIQPIFHPIDLMRLGEMRYQTGCQLYYADEQKQNDAQAFASFMQAAQCGNRLAYYMLGECHFLGRGCERSIENAKEWFRLAANQGNIDAMLWMSEHFILDKKISLTEAHHWLCQAALLNHPAAQFRLGTLLFHSKQNALQIEAYRWFLRASAQGFTLATCFIEKHYSDEFTQSLNLVSFYQQEVSLGYLFSAKDLALHFIFKARLKNEEELKQQESSPDIQYRLAMHYLSSEKPPEKEEGLKKLAHAAAEGHIQACNELAYRYHKGIDVKQNDWTAYKYLLTSANKGDAAAQYNIAMHIEHGIQEKLEPSAMHALVFYQRAAEQHHPDAMLKMAGFYSLGLLVKKDQEKARTLRQDAKSILQKLAQSGDKDAAQKLEKLSSSTQATLVSVNVNTLFSSVSTAQTQNLHSNKEPSNLCTLRECKR